MKRFKLLLLPLLCAHILTAPGFITPAGGTAQAAPANNKEAGIAIVINDRAISYLDLNNRLNLIIASSGLPDTAETRQKLAPQVISSLIDEQLQRQEAERLEISVSETQIDAAFNELAKANNMSPDQFSTLLKENKASITSLRQQIEARLLWGEVFSKSLRRRVRISNADIDSYIQRLKNQIGTTEYLLSEIFLPVDTPSDEADIKALARKVVQDLSGNKSAFAAVARQISKAPGAENGGVLGWVQGSQLDQNVEQSIKALSAQSISAPIRSADGYHIFYLGALRTITEESIPSRDDVRQKLGIEQAERISRNHLKSLRSAAFIDNRIGTARAGNNDQS